ncbi:MAG: hypothetical protein WA639_03100, partial [Candidatus Acidiferrum sp.]
MTCIPRLSLGFTVAGLLVASAALAAPQSQPSSQSSAPAQTQQQPAAQQPASTQPQPQAPV